jgi:hypothetical protein
LDLTPEERKRFVVEVAGSSLQEIPASVSPGVIAIAHRHRGFLGQDYQALKVITFLVDFKQREGTLRELFRLWLKKSPHREKWRENAKPPTDRWKTILGDIVILRATEAGMTREVAKEELSPLWKKWRYYSFTEGKLSRPHWRRSLVRAKALREEPQIVVADPPWIFGSETELFEIRLRGMSTFVPVPSKPKTGLCL